MPPPPWFMPIPLFIVSLTLQVEIMCWCTTSERDSLKKSGWHIDSMSWIAPSTSTTPVYRLHNRITGEHFYTDDNSEKTKLLKNKDWQLEAAKTKGVAFYSGGKEPVYRLYNKSGKHFHTWTTNSAEKDYLIKHNWHYEGIAFYAIYPDQNWSYDATYYTYSGQKGDVHYPQFDYLTSSGSKNATYQNNNTYAAYNNSVYNFNVALTQTAANVDYTDWQLRQAWNTKLNSYKVTANDAKVALDTANGQVSKHQTLVNQYQTYVADETAKRLSTVNDQALLTQYQASLVTAQTAASTANTNYQVALDAQNKFSSQGTDNVTLIYSITRSVDNKTVYVKFTQKTKTNGRIATTNWTSRAVIYGEKFIK